jgi:shikimate kinase
MNKCLSPLSSNKRWEPILIGFPGSGKSTLACRLSGLMDLPVVSIDAIAPQLMPHLGMDSEFAESLYTSGRVIEWLDYVRPFEHATLQIILSSHEDCIFDVGAGHVIGNRPVSLTDALKEFVWVIHVRTSSSCHDEEAACRKRLLRRLRRINEVAPDPVYIAEETAKYFARQWTTYSNLATLVANTGTVSSSSAARKLAEHFCQVGV